ncbi:MAG: TonB-dependent receptor [Bacteroidales bacterium]|nr:TonB-dependent receptor [Bacteroidales bacterium]
MKSIKLLVVVAAMSIVVTQHDALAIDASSPAPAAAPQNRVTGQIIDVNGEPLIGANVATLDSQTGTVTDVDGRFSINVPDGTPLQVSFIGYVSQQLKAGSNMKIVLKEDYQDLEETVVIGYGAVKKRDLTGAVASVKSDEIVKTPTTNVMEALQGQVAGFDITRSTGEVGASMNMTLRGNRSIYGNNAPLFIIDGMEGSYDELNTNDIASVEVLKDAASTAIYGAAGANGVVIITTKSAKRDKLQIDLDAYYGWNVISRFPEINSHDKYVDFRREAMKNAGLYTDEANLFPSYLQQLINNNQWVDWFDEGSHTGTLQQYNLSATYASEKVNTFLSLGYNDVSGMLKGDELKRYSMRAKVDVSPNRYVAFGANLYGMYSDNDKRNSRIWNRMLCTPPLGTPYDEDGNVVLYPVGGDTGSQSPITDTGEGQYTNNVKKISLTPQAYFELKPITGLSLKTVIGGYFNATKQGIYEGNKSFNGLATGSYASVPNTLSYNMKWQNILTYNFKLFKAHDFTFTGVTEWSNNHREVNTAAAYGFDSDSYTYHNLAAGTNGYRVSSSYVQNQMMSYVTRLSYSYLGRYLLSASARWDGSSILAEGNKWDVFPSVSGAWRISDEAFMSGTSDWLDNLKLRASWGITGNAGAAEYATMAYSTTGQYGMQDVATNYSEYSSNIANPGLGWEKTYTWDIGLDMTLLGNRLDIVFDWYSSTTRGLLFQRSLPYAVGGSAGSGGVSTFKIWENVGKTRNQGIELTLNSRNIIRRNFTWNTTLTFAKNNEEVLQTTSENPLQYGDYYLIPGEGVHTYYLYKYLGCWGTAEADEAAKFGAKPGQIKVEDVDGDGKYSATDYQIIGNADPSWTASLTNSFTFYDFDFSFQLVSRWDWTIAYGVTGWYRTNGLSPSPAVCDYWSADNQGARFPAPDASSATGLDSYQSGSSINYFDGSYIKIKNLTFGYTLPKNVLKKFQIEKARIYFTAANPLIWTKSEYLKDYDPEKGGDDDDAPLYKQFVVGVNLTF